MQAFWLRGFFAQLLTGRGIQDLNMRRETVCARVTILLTLGCATCLLLASSKVVPVHGSCG